MQLIGAGRTVNSLNWVNQGVPNAWRADINANWYLWTTSRPPTSGYRIIGPAGQLPGGFQEWQINEKLNNGFFEGGIKDKQMQQQITNNNGNGKKIKVQIDPGPQKNTGQDTIETTGLFGLSNMQLLLIGLAVIAVIYFIKKK